MEVPDQRLGILDGPLPGDHAHDQSMIGVERHVVPMVTLAISGRVGGVAVGLLLGDEGPLLIVLGLAVRGAAGDQLVVQTLRIGPGVATIAGDGLPVDADKPAGLADAVPSATWWRTETAFSGGKRASKRGVPLRSEKRDLQIRAAEHTARLPGSVAMGHGKISDPPLAVVGAFGIQAAEP